MSSTLSIIVSMSPPGHPSAWLHPCRACFRFTWHSHCSSKITGGLVVILDFGEPGGRPPGSARFRHHVRLTRRQRTIAVVNSRVKRLWKRRSFLMGTSSRLANLKGLRAINFSNFAIVIWFSPPATSLNRVAPSVLKVERQRIRAFSLNIRCAHGKTENR